MSRKPSPMANIVICDDEPHITRAMAVKLKRAGHTVQTGCNGAEALAFIRERTPDLLITDCQMPVMTGLQLCGELRSTPATAMLPIVMLTAKGLEISEEELQRELGVSRLLFKPFSPREVLTVAEDLMNRPKAESAVA